MVYALHSGCSGLRPVRVQVSGLAPFHFPFSVGLRGGTGRRGRFKPCCRQTWRFDLSRGHHSSSCAGVAETVDAADLSSAAARRAGSKPAARTKDFASRDDRARGPLAQRKSACFTRRMSGFRNSHGLPFFLSSSEFPERETGAWPRRISAGDCTKAGNPTYRRPQGFIHASPVLPARGRHREMADSRTARTGPRKRMLLAYPTREAA